MKRLTYFLLTVLFTCNYGAVTRFLSSITYRKVKVDTDAMIPQLFQVLEVAGLVEPVIEAKKEGEPPGYQLPADGMVWLAGDGRSPFYDPVRMPRQPKSGLRANDFFVDFYTRAATDLQNTQAREHTAQVPMEERLDREGRFRTAQLPILYCSPTMELVLC